MRKVDFFIIGAPKCGTTAMAQYLDEHPQIFISKPKEPHFFSDDLDRKLRSVHDEKSYKQCFKDVRSCHRAIGEASVWYLYSDSAIKNIYRYNRNAKLIVMLRHPVDMIHSLHNQLLLTCDENIQDFSEAIKAQEARIKGERIPRSCREKKILQYFDTAMFGRLVERVLGIFPEKQVKIIFFDDFSRNTRSSYMEVLDFLGIQYDEKSDFPVINERWKLKSFLINQFTARPPQYLISFSVFLKKVLWVERWGVINFIRRLNNTKNEHHPMEINLFNSLVQVFINDIERLEKIVDKDLCHWKRLK